MNLINSDRGAAIAAGQGECQVSLKSSIVACVAVAAASLWFGQAQAATYDLNLSGSVGNAVPFSFRIGNTLYQGESLFSLSGLDSSKAFSVSQGDQINVTVTLDAPWNVPASVSNSSVLLSLTSPSFLASGAPTANAGTVTLYDGATQVASISDSNTTGGQVSLGGFLPDNKAFAFDSATFDFTVNSLGSMQTVNEANLFYELQTVGVPEPATWAMLVAGLACLGAALRSRRKSGAALATA